jgi:hypothetical protein
VWGKCRWELEGEISILCIVGKGRLIAVTECVVFLLAYGSNQPIDVFTPGVEKCRKVIGICKVPGTSLVCIIQGNNEILIWNWMTLLITGFVRVSCKVKGIVSDEKSVFCLLESGRIVRIDPQNCFVKEEIYCGEGVLGFGVCNERLYSVSGGDGSIRIWENGIAKEWGKSETMEVRMHSRRVVAIGKNNEKVMVLKGEEKNPEMLECDPVRSFCWDSVGPLCAFGHYDGTVSVWRIAV